MKRPRRGRAVIINNRDFDPVLTRQKNRDGTDVDAEELEKMLMRLGFDVTRHDNLKTFDMSIQLREGLCHFLLTNLPACRNTESWLELYQQYKI